MQYRTGEVGQLIKVADFDNAVVTGTLRAKDWDPVTNTGGVLVLYIKETLTLEAPLMFPDKVLEGQIRVVMFMRLICAIMKCWGFSVKIFTMKTKCAGLGLKGKERSTLPFISTRGKSNVINGGGGW